MSFNIVDIIIVAVIGLSLVSGMYKGFIASGLAAIGFVASWFGAMNLYPQLTTIIMNNKSLMDVLKYYLDAGGMFKTRALGETLVSTVAQDGSLLNSAINELSNLPQIITDQFRVNVSTQLFQNLNLNTFSDYLGQTILAAAVNVVAFLIVFVVAYLILLLVVNLLNSVFHFPLLKHFDWLLGGIFGGARGYVIVMLILAVVPMILSMVDMKVVTDLMDSSLLVKYFPTNFAIPDIVKAAFS